MDGYVRKYCNKCIPIIVIQIIFQYYDKNNIINCTVYGSKDTITKIIDNITDVYVSETSFYYITKNNKLYVNGRNNESQLGMKESIDEYKIPKLHPSFANDTIKFVSQSIFGCHAFVCTTKNKIYGMGTNLRSQIDSSNALRYMTPKLIVLPKQWRGIITSIECGISHSLFLTSKEEVYGCGSNIHGQITGIRSKIRCFQKCKQVRNIIKIGCSGYTSYMLDSNGVLFGYGYQCESHTFKELNNILINTFSPGGSFIGCLTDDNDVYMYGSNHCSQCGISHKDANIICAPTNIIRSPTKLNINFKIMDIKCGCLHTIIRSTSGDWYAFGNKVNNRCLSFDDSIESTPIPTKISIKLLLSKLACDNPIIDLIPTFNQTLILQQN